VGGAAIQESEVTNPWAGISQEEIRMIWETTQVGNSVNKSSAKTSPDLKAMGDCDFCHMQLIPRKYAGDWCPS